VTDEIRPRRTALYMPGANDKALEKAKDEKIKKTKEFPETTFKILLVIYK